MTVSTPIANLMSNMDVLMESKGCSWIIGNDRYAWDTYAPTVHSKEEFISLLQALNTVCCYNLKVDDHDSFVEVYHA